MVSAQDSAQTQLRACTALLAQISYATAVGPILQHRALRHRRACVRTSIARLVSRGVQLRFQTLGLPHAMIGLVPPIPMSSQENISLRFMVCANRELELESHPVCLPALAYCRSRAEDPWR